MSASMSALVALAPLAAILPDSLDFYLAMMVIGFVIGVIGHVVDSKPIVALGILLVFLATMLLPIAVNVFSERPEFPRIQQP